MGRPKTHISKLASERDYITTYAIDLTSAPSPRHHIVLLDGTWNDENGPEWTNPLTGETRRIVTNLVKLDHALAPDAAAQIATYHRGIGNDEDNKKIQRLFAGAFGADEVCIRAGAYAQLALDYHPGDIISIFGFSRGAACARMLANDLARHGVPETIEVTRRLWNDDYRIVRCRIPKKTRQEPVKVAFLGLWDTVGSFGIPLDIGPLPFGKINLGKDLDLAPNVERAAHCVALDEDRTAYDRVLLAGPESVVEEVWFPGVHSDIGGGYGFDALGRKTFEFMITRWERTLQACGAPPPAWNEQEKQRLLPAPDDVIVRHWHRRWPLPRQPRRLATQSGPLPKVHASVDELIARGSTWLTDSSEKNPLVLRNYNPPNYTARDEHVVVRT